MGGKENKKNEKKSRRQFKSTDEQPNNSKLWPDLPHQLIYLIARKSSLKYQICSKGVTKSWRVEPNKCRPNSRPPWLELSSDYRSQHKETHTFNIPFKMGFFCYWRKERCVLPAYHILGCSHGLLVAKGDSDYSLCDPITLSWWSYWHIPEWDPKVPFLSAALSSPPRTGNRKNKCIVMVLTGISNPAFAFYRISEGREWIKKDSNIVDPHCSSSSLLQFTNGIWCKEKFYALSLQGTLAVIEDIDSDLSITALGKKRAVPSVLSMHFRECLMESEGKILLVFLISRKCIKVVDCLEVYQLDTAKLTWVKKENLGSDRTLFVGGNCCMSVSASEVGCRKNCVYFTQGKVDGWWVYDMETSTINSFSEFPAWDEAMLIE
uniref:KIB1-4 beta-propeller domain-containing protein n=1 Tax=Manihot esculenta TaxID=3983 RepID=A0A2C9V4U5_MANES